MQEIVLGIFSSSVNVEYTIHDLKISGYNTKHITILLSNKDQTTVSLNSNSARKIHIALREIGLSHDEAKKYEKRIIYGDILMAIPVMDNHIEELNAILEENDADQIITISTSQKHRFGKIFLS